MGSILSKHVARQEAAYPFTSILSRMLHIVQLVRAVRLFEESVGQHLLKLAVMGN